MWKLCAAQCEHKEKTTGVVGDKGNLIITVQSPSGEEWAEFVLETDGKLAELNAPAGSANNKVGYWNRSQSGWQSQSHCPDRATAPNGNHEISGRVENNGDLLVEVKWVSSESQSPSKVCASVHTQADGTAVVLYDHNSTRHDSKRCGNWFRF